MKFLRLIIIIALCFCVLTTPPHAYADSTSSPEYLIKAAFIYNFAMFVQWPSDAFPQEDSPIVIGIVGHDPFGSGLDHTVRDNKVKKRSIVVKRLQWGQDVRGCHILFVSSSETARFADLANNLKDLPVLVVGETPSFAKRSGIINFTVEDKRVRCEINVEAAKRARLSISSKLLNLAKIIHGS